MGRGAAALLELVDPRLREVVWAEIERCPAPPALNGHVVLVGHRGAGKSQLLRPLAALLSRPHVDLDQLIAERAGAPVRTLFERSERAFRQAERGAFAAIGGRALVAAGGGFLSNHADLLAAHTPVLVPITFDTYVERMHADTRRPRLRPELTLEEEIETVFAERELLHRGVQTVPLAALLRSLP